VFRVYSENKIKGLHLQLFSNNIRAI